MGGSEAQAQAQALIEEGEMVSFAEFRVKNQRSQVLHAVKYQPMSGTPVGVVVFQHGIEDHAGRYKHVFKRLAASGIAVYAYDAHGNGKSEPKPERFRSYIGNFQYMVDDYLQVAQLASAEQAGIPLFGSSQSVGGLFLCHAILRTPAVFSGVVLFSAAVAMKWTPTIKFLAAIGNILAVCCPYARIVPGPRPKHMSQDPNVVKGKKGGLPNLRARTGNECLKAFKRLQKLRQGIKMPVLAIHGTSDRSYSLRSVKEFLAVIASNDKTLKEINGGYHELLMGPEREECTQVCIDWLLKHISASTSSTKATGAGGSPSSKKGGTDGGAGVQDVYIAL